MTSNAIGDAPCFAVVIVGFTFIFITKTVVENIEFLADHPDFAQDNVKSKLGYLIREEMFPDTPLLSDSDWQVLRNYYVESAAEEPLPQSGKPDLDWQLPQFKIVHLK